MNLKLSSLTTRRSVLKLHVKSGSRVVTWFTAIATFFAEAEWVNIIIVGWDLEEAVTFLITPENSWKPSIMFEMLDPPEDILVEAPVINMNKSNIVKLGVPMGDLVNPVTMANKNIVVSENQVCGVKEHLMRFKLKRRLFT